MDQIINNNPYESRILKVFVPQFFSIASHNYVFLSQNYLPAEGSSLQDMLQICLVKLDSGEYHCSGLFYTNNGGHIQWFVSTDSRSSQASSETIICYKCALKNFRDLAYLYREDIPIERLPSKPHPLAPPSLSHLLYVQLRFLGGVTVTMATTVALSNTIPAMPSMSPTHYLILCL